MTPFPRGPFDVIYADPPWSYRDSANAGRRGAVHKYPTLTIDEIRSLPVADIAADDAVLFLWVTFPLLPDCLSVIPAWGFSYKTAAFVWHKKTAKGKDVFGMGHWTRSNAELCVLAVRGRPKRVDAGVRQIVEAHTARHSEKPAEVRDRIVQLCGDVPRVELFARTRAAGWKAWGNEV